MDKDLPKGFKCACGEWHEYVPYVYAHWRIVLTTVCDKCGLTYKILKGKATMTEDDG